MAEESCQVLGCEKFQRELEDRRDIDIHVCVCLRAMCLERSYNATTIGAARNAG